MEKNLHFGPLVHPSLIDFISFSKPIEFNLFLGSRLFGLIHNLITIKFVQGRNKNGI